MSGPEISVLMGVYYHKSDVAPLERSVCSILAQHDVTFEYLICDDGSSEEAKLFLEKMADQDSRISLIRPGGRFTLAEKLNTCLYQANGTFIARMDDDDYSEPDRFVCQLAYLKAHAEISFVGCNVRLRREGKTVGIWKLPEYPSVADFYMTQPFIHPTLLFRRTDLLEVNGYSETRSCILCEDYDLLLRLYAAGHTGANMQTLLFEYTLPPDAKGNRRFRHRVNEAVTRYRRFQELGCLPTAWPFVLKPLAVGLIPERILGRIKKSKIECG